MSHATTHPGCLHQIPRPSIPSQPPLIVFEHTPHPTQNPPKNTLLFLPGLFDGPLTVPYTPALAASLPEDWRLVEPILGSSYQQWGISSLDEDVVEIVQIVSYFRGMDGDAEGGKVVLMGHSTGCQMIMHYLLNSSYSVTHALDNRLPGIDGAIMQGSVSDRESLTQSLSASEYTNISEIAEGYIEDDRMKHVLPLHLTQKTFGNAPVTAERWISLASPGPEHAGTDDYFSSDFDDERLGRTFGAIGKLGVRISFLYADEDEYVPDFVDKRKLVGRWEHFVKSSGGLIDEGSGVLVGASHTLKEGGMALLDMEKRVMGFLERV